MTNFQKTGGNARITRRSVLAGSAATMGAVALGAVPSTAFAIPTGLRTPAPVPVAGKSRGETTLAKYLCESVHEKIANRLDAIIADPAVDGEQTALALMEARCPGCNGRVHPAKSSLSAVIPQWRKPTGYHNPVQGVSA